MTLLPGDILLFRVDPGAPLLGRLIGWAEVVLNQPHTKKRNYYHVGFVSSDPRQFYQARPPRICLSPIPDPLPSYIEVYRVKVGLDPGQLLRLFHYADSRLGMPYDFLGVLTGGYVEIGGLEFCSKYTNDAFSHIPLVLRPAETLISPDDIAASDVLMRVY